MTSEKDLSDSFKEVPPFLEILGFKGAKLLDDESFICDFSPSVELTHSNGMIVQGGFVTGMLDACMAQFIIYKYQGQKIPLTLDIDVKFFMPCAPGDVRAISKIAKEGKSISFTEAKLFQNDKLIAISTATNKIVPTKI